MVRRLLPLLVLSLTLHAQSRYLADTAGAPVKWEGWGTRAFERSKNEKRPIFVSIGYASSFDCFRMQREAFLNGEVAEALNAYYIPTLLDRLEYPEVAEAYDAIARTMNVKPDSPLLMILTPTLEPFAVAGYLGTSDLSRLLVLNANRWAHERDAVVAEARQNMLKARARNEPPKAEEPLSAEALRKLALTRVRDQLGGGFHRSDTKFEKMLADQARYAVAYTVEWQTTHDPQMATLARSTLDAVIRDLRQPKTGAFDASQDAHSLVPAQGPEFWNGAFYIWQKDEVTHLLGHEAARKIFGLYGLIEGERNVLAVADEGRLTDPALPPLLAKLLDVRQKRPQPFRESNVISGLNGLMISAMARGGAVFGEEAYLQAATLAANYMKTNLWNAQKKTLLHSAGVPANVDDYALLTQGVLDLFEATYDPKWLDFAIALQQRADAHVRGASVPEVLRGLEAPFDPTVSDRNAFRLALLTGMEPWRTRQAPSLANAKIVAVTGDPRRKNTYDALHTIHERLDPSRFVIFVPSRSPAKERITRTLPFTGAFAFDKENPIVYECMNGQCTRR